MTAPGHGPRVSVLLPCYNGAAYLGEAIGSILAQSFGDFELVIVDDGSTDASVSIVERIAAADDRIRLVRKANGGIVSALNAGLAICTGEFVARMDADDVAFPHRLATQVAWLDSHPGCVCVGGYAVADPVPRVESARTFGGHHARTDLTIFPPKVALAMHPLIMVRRIALETIGGYREGFRHAEDYDLFLRLSRFGSIDNPPIDMLYYRRHEGALSVRNVDQQEESAILAELDAFVASGRTRPPEWLLAAYLRLRIWRRYQSVDPVRAAAMTATILADFLAVAPHRLMTPGALRLRASTAKALLRWRKRRRRLRLRPQ